MILSTPYLHFTRFSAMIFVPKSDYIPIWLLVDAIFAWMNAIHVPITVAAKLVTLRIIVKNHGVLITQFWDVIQCQDITKHTNIWHQNVEITAHNVLKVLKIVQIVLINFICRSQITQEFACPVLQTAKHAMIALPASLVEISSNWEEHWTKHVFQIAISFVIIAPLCKILQIAHCL